MRPAAQPTNRLGGPLYRRPAPNSAGSAAPAPTGARRDDSKPVGWRAGEAATRIEDTINPACGPASHDTAGEAGADPAPAAASPATSARTRAARAPPHTQ